MKTFLTMFCIICTTYLLHAQTIKQVEYFIDSDKGVGKNTKLNLAASTDSSYQVNIDVSDVSVGFHKLYIRTKDNKNKWSLTAREDIEITSSFNQPTIIAGEYFFDKDPGYGKGKKITVSPKDIEVEENFVAVTASLTNGFHKLYTRFKSNEDTWSITSKTNVEIVKAADTANIIAVEYFFTNDNGFDKATAKTFATTSPDSTFKFKIAYNKIPAGADSLFIRVQDDNGNWSTTKIASFSIQLLLKEAVITDAKITDNNYSLRAFPNPASKDINIIFQSKNKSAFMQIFDENGKAVLQKTVTPAISNNINISRLASGTYIVQIKDEGIIKSVKFIKQ